MGIRWRSAAFAVLASALAVPGAAVGQHFPSADVTESPRAHPPNDPGFDECEPDDPDTAADDCTTYFDEQFGSFGFSPDSANQAPGVPHAAGATRYLGCSQLDDQGRRANRAAGDPRCAQIAGVRADTAWKYSTGDPQVVVAILDTGIRWQDTELVNKVHLNRAELPEPRSDRVRALADERSCASFEGSDDANRDGAFNVLDFACDPRVRLDGGDEEADEILDPSDLIAAFSDGTDGDANGYRDDIAGWDFFDDDNDPFDSSSCCSSRGHGTDRAKEAAAETDNGEGETGMCPECQVMPLRIWDTFVLDTNLYAMGVVYATDNGASVVEGAVGGLLNSSFARRAFAYADRKGVALTLVSSDINTANHNYPTNYNEAIYISGSLPDTAPFDTCSGPGSLPGIGDFLDFGDLPGLGGAAAEGCRALLGTLHDELGLVPTAQPVTTSFFRNSNLTQYGGKADIVMMAQTGSVATGQASGAAGLLASFGGERFADQRQFPKRLSGNQIRQLMTMTAEDVLPENTGQLGLPDRANRGWDSHFGYGRLNLTAAMRRIANRRIPPEAQLDAPDWFAPINVDRVRGPGIPIKGRVAAPHSAPGVGSWEVEYACGQDARDSEFEPIPGASGTGPADGRLGTLPRGLLLDLAENCDGSVTNDAGRPAGTLTDPWPADPYPDPDPERHAFQIRLTAHEAGDRVNIGRYRKTLFAYRDDGNLAGWPRPIGRGSNRRDLVTGSGGEAPPRLYDLDGDNALDVVLPTSSGELYVLRADGRPLASWNRGRPVRTRPYAVARAHPPPGGAGPPPREPLRAPAIGDIDGDLEPEVVATAGEHLYAWNADGSVARGFPARVRRSLSEPCAPGAPDPCFDAEDRVVTEENHIKRGFIGSPALADLDCNGRLDAVAGSLDQHVYAWNGRGKRLRGFPVKLDAGEDDVSGAEIITSPAIAELDGKACGQPGGGPEVVLATNELAEADPTAPSGLADLLSALASSAIGTSFTYAIHGDGSPVEGWPLRTGVLAGDLLPLAGPGNDAAALDVDGDGEDEVSTSAFTGDARLVDGDGTPLRSYLSAAGNRLDQSPVVNAADYSIVGDVLGAGVPSVFKGGVTLGFAAGLLASNQNLPANHVVQGWDPRTGISLPGYPRATDDFQFLTQGAIAKVNGGGVGRQVLYPTGLYQLHAYGPGGLEPEGWPKFAGGWLTTTPSVGDANGDGKLDVVSLTREGWAFLWGTDAPACDADGEATNEEWWTFHHDEHGTANYGHDARPPGTPDGLRGTRRDRGSVVVSWKAPGDDWWCGKAERYRLLLSSRPIRDPRDGRVVAEGGGGAGAGTAVQVTLAPGQVDGGRHLAVHYFDESGNSGQLAQERILTAR